MRVAITGASGHIGAALCRKLINEGHEVVALVRKSSKGIDGLKLEIVQGDILDLNSLRKLMENADVVIHAASVISLKYKFDQRLHDVNVQGTQNVLQVAKELGIKKIIHFSSIHVFNHTPQDEVLDETREYIGDNAIFYDVTKRDAHILALKAAEEGLDVSILCPTGVIGPYDFQPSKLGKAIKAIHNGTFPVMIRGGFDFVDVRDVVAATIGAIKYGKKGEAYIVGGNYFSLKEIADIILKIKGKKRKMLELPLFIGRIGVPFVWLFSKLTNKEPLFDNVYLDILKDGNKHVDSGKALSELKFKPTDIETTLTDKIDWFKQQEK